MTRLYKATVNDSWMRSQGLGWFVQFGEPRTVDGTPMVQLSSGIFPATGWHADEQSAVREAADRIERIGHKLIRQAVNMRIEAAKEVQHA